MSAVSCLLLSAYSVYTLANEPYPNTYFTHPVK